MTGVDAPRLTVTAEEEEARETPEGERKTVTALFADIKGSMDLMEDLDPDEARTLVDPALKLMMEAVHRYDGYTVQSTADGIFVDQSALHKKIDTTPGGPAEGSHPVHSKGGTPLLRLLESLGRG